MDDLFFKTERFEKKVSSDFFLLGLGLFRFLLVYNWINVCTVDVPTRSIGITYMMLTAHAEGPLVL